MILGSEADLRTYRRIWRAFAVLAAMAELGLFEHLEIGEVRSPAALAERLEVDPRALRICLDVLQAQGILIREDGAYRLAASAPAILAALGEMRHEVKQLPLLASCLRTGRPLTRTIGGVALDDDAEVERFLSGLHRRSGPSVPEVVRAVRTAWERSSEAAARGPRILDLGGGHGCFAAAFASGIPGAEVTLFDRAPVLEVARRLSGDGFRRLSGDYFRDSLGGPYDVVFLSNILHGETPRDVTALLARIRVETDPAGAIVVRDRFLSDSGLGPDYVADFGLTLLFNTDVGHPRTLGGAMDLLRDAGFPAITHYELSAEEYGILIARAAR